ncbi:MAG: hypothetical protein KatS3mg051_0283 [Anaerolineae bacterium]|nr:MAG: hypothetical protein KatS3mg051_0283 [Anaerolineae bacterium]
MNASSAPERATYRLALGGCLVIGLIAVYFFTFNGHAISRDEWFLLDATESLARRGTLAQNYHFDAYPPLSLAEVSPPQADFEPLQPALAVPLFLIAQSLPAIGLAHTVWLFNILITALTAGTLYAYGLALGYRARVAVLAALAFGVGTIAWPYSRTFFREPLFAWLSLGSAYLVLRTRQRLSAGQPALWLAMASVGGIGLTLFAKEAALLLLPAVLLEALPTRPGRLRLARRQVIALVLIALVSVAAGSIALNADTLFGLSNRYAFVQRLRQVRAHLPDLGEGVLGYLISPGRSLWLFSPVLLLGLAGLPHLARQGRWRQVAVPLMALVSMVVGYAAVRGADQWYGGRGWGPRYMVPLTPFLALWLLPVSDMLAARGASRRAQIGALLVLALSVAVQVLGIFVPLDAYDRTLASQTPPVIAWEEGAWSPRWSQLWVSAQLIGTVQPDIAWRHAAGREAWLLPVLSVTLALAALGGAAWLPRHQGISGRKAATSMGALILGAVLVLLGGLYGIRRDPRYYGDFAPARALLAALQREARNDDVIVLNNSTYTAFFMNYYKRSAPIVYTLPPAPGERYSPEQAPDLVSSNPDELIHYSSALVAGALAQDHDRLWLVLESSRAMPWSVRPLEHYLARHAFPVREIAPTDLARAVLFDLTAAPLPTQAAWPDYLADVRFGESVRLIGFDLPGHGLAHAGDTLTVSLLWQAVAPIAQDYTVALLLLSPDGRLVAQRDALPVNGFAPMSTWKPGALIRDNHGVALPADLPTGDYELWLAVYWWQTPGDRLPVTDSAGVSLGDHAVLARITVR